MTAFGPKIQCMSGDRRVACAPLPGLAEANPSSRPTSSPWQPGLPGAGPWSRVPAGARADADPLRPRPRPPSRPDRPRSGRCADAARRSVSRKRADGRPATGTAVQPRRRRGGPDRRRTIRMGGSDCSPPSGAGSPTRPGRPISSCAPTPNRFVLVLGGTRDSYGLAAARRRICDVLSRPVLIDGRPVRSPVAVGVAPGGGRRHRRRAARPAPVGSPRGTVAAAGACAAWPSRTPPPDPSWAD